VGLGEGVKPRLSQALTRGARPDSNSRPAMQISNPLPSRYASWGTILPSLLTIALTLKVKSSFQRDSNVICGLI